MNLQPRAAVFELKDDAAYLSCATDIINGSPRRFAEALQTEENFHIIYRPAIVKMKKDADQEQYPEFEPFVKCCYLRGRMAIFIDEAHLFCTPYAIPETLMLACTLGRARELDIFYICQSLQRVSRTLRQNTSEFFFWRVTEPADIDAIAERCGSELANRVQNLRRLTISSNGLVIPGERIHWNIWNGIDSDRTLLLEENG
jgi:hypothetical protein